jgi:hypothetical protein
MKFKWDNKKAVSNLKKRGVSFQEASSIFSDPLAITFDDPDHSVGEERYLTFGISYSHCLLTVVHAQKDDMTRIISGRVATRKERKIYEEE